MHTILIIDDDEGLRKLLKEFFEQAGYIVYLATNGTEGWQIFQEVDPLVVLLDQVLPDTRGIELLKKMKQYDPLVQTIIITGYGAVKEAVQAMELGAVNYLLKPFDLQELKILIEQVIERTTLKRERDHYRKKMQVLVRGRVMPLLFQSTIMKKVFEQCQQVAKTNTTVLLEGESGTGKGLLAHYLHQISNRAEGPFIDVDCTAIPETLLESELFGYEPGAFTDAKKRKEGLIELAHQGTLFLDEIGVMPITLQGKLLKVIEEKHFRKLGGKKETSVDVRTIVATNANLKELIKQGKFREDLYFRISTFSINLPSLRERKEDIAPLVKHFFEEIKKEVHKETADIEPAALTILTNYDWPGNIRELRNTIEKAVIIARGKMLTASDLGISLSKTAPVLITAGLTYEDAKKHFEIELLKKALEQADGNQTQAAKFLGVSRNFLIRRMKKYKI